MAMPLSRLEIDSVEAAVRAHRAAVTQHADHTISAWAGTSQLFAANYWAAYARLVAEARGLGLEFLDKPIAETKRRRSADHR